ncbi:hypothetical protein HKD37_04G010078 [Glycine soja]
MRSERWPAQKKTGQMTFEAAKEIVEKIDVLTTLIWQPEHPGRVCAAGAGVTIKQYFGPTQRTSRTFSFIAPKELEQLTQRIRDQLEELITEKGLALPPEPEVGPSATRVSTKGSCVDPSATNPNGDLDRCGLYIEENPPRLVALGKVYEGSTVIHNISLLHDQVKVGFEEVKDADAPIPVPTDEGAVSLAKPSDRSHPEVDDPLYLMTLTIPQLFLKSLQVMWDASLFRLFNSDFPLYIKHEDLSEIAHGGQWLSISIIQLWILPNNYMKGIINSALKGLDDTPQPKSKVVGARWIVVKCNKQKGSTECGYYVMHWMSTIILRSFRNNWEMCFNDVRPLELDTLKALHIQWANYYLKVRNET